MVGDDYWWWWQLTIFWVEACKSTAPVQPTDIGYDIVALPPTA
jgi:hypothetical protein